jgi:hypothetical protein
LGSSFVSAAGFLFVSAIAALREIRANLELLGKLSGELANQNINFYALDITQERIKEFFAAAKLRSPQLGDYVQRQAREQFGYTPPAVQINFADRPGLAPPKQIITPKGMPDPLLLEADSSTSGY